MNKRQLKEIVVQQREELKRKEDRKIPEDPARIDNQRCEAVWKIDSADTDHVKMVR
jgi:hypothetical protein